MAKLGWGKILAGVATVAAAGAAYVYLRQRAVKAPRPDVLLADGPFEIRRYPAMLTIETIQHGSRDRALGNGFGLLAAYMFGEAREGEEIPIVMPVLAELVDKGAWRIRFIIADEYRDLLEAPGEGMLLGEIPMREVAVLSVPGKAGDRLFATKTVELRRWIEEQGRHPAGEAQHAYHNSPLKPGANRPNELLIPLAAKAATTG